MDASADAPVAPPGDGGITAPDAPVDAAPGGDDPFPADPQGGEFAWVVSAPGAGDLVSTAVDGLGNIVVAARQTGEVTLGTVRVPGPASGEAVVVLKLSPDGQPIWGHALDGHDRTSPRALATTATGDVVVGGSFYDGTFEPPFDEAFVAVIDGATGATRWSQVFSSSGDDLVAGVAAAGDAIYVYGASSASVTIAGQVVPPGGYLIRYDADGTVRWLRSFAVRPGFSNALVVDPARGPVIVGRFDGELAIGGQAVSGHGLAIVGFDPDGEVRFVRPVLSDSPPVIHSLALAPSGDLYVATDNNGTEAVVDDHIIPRPDVPDHPYLLRLTADGQFVAVTEIANDRSELSKQSAVDPTGAAYQLVGCHGRIDVQPEVSCAGDFGPGGVIVSYGPDNGYRWATYIKSAFVEAIAAAPGNRMIVAGEALTPTTDFGGVRAPTQSLFIAALAGGPARTPSPLPPAPAITSAALDGVLDGQLRQGDTGTLVIRGAALDQVTSAKLGDIDVHIRPGTATAGELRLAIMIPHGHAPGPLTLELGNATGVARHPATVTVTPIVVSPTGAADGRGTFSSPMRLCGNNFTFARHGDLVLLRSGTHECDESVGAFSGVTFRGESKAGTIVTGGHGANDRFKGFYSFSETDDLGELAIENLTITSADFAAIDLGLQGKVAVTDVDVVGVSGSGISVDSGARARVTRYRYLHGTGTALVAGIAFGSGEIDARDVVVDDAFRGVLVTRGAVRLTRAQLSSREVAVQAGDLDDHLGTRDVTITSSTLRSPKGGFLGGLARLTMTDTTIEAVASDGALRGIELWGGSISGRDSRIAGWKSAGIFATPHIEIAFPGANLDAARGVEIDLDGVEISGSPLGIRYKADLATDRFRLHGSRVQATTQAVVLENNFVADLGTAAAPGDNRLDASSGAPALLDTRTTAGPPIDAHGTTLNGLDFSGDFLGPVTTAGYQLAGPNTIRF